MKANIKIFIISMLFTLFLISCSNSNKQPLSPNPETPIGNSPGMIDLTYLDGLGKIQKNNRIFVKNDSAVFTLGDIKGSRDFYFLVRNVGSNSIENIQIVSTNPQFDISPSEISVLKPEQSSALSPILRVSAIHGIALDGIGFTDLMKMDTNTTTIIISGHTLNENNNDTTIDFSGKMIVNAFLMDMELYDGDRSIDLNSPDFGTSTNLGGLGFLRGYYFNNIPKVKNIGNVDIILSYHDISITVDPDTISPNDFVQLTFLSNIARVEVRVDGNNTVTDNNKLQIGNDGSGYFAFMRQ